MLITPAQRPPLGRAQEEVYVTVYASSLDPFPSEVRTYDVMGRMDLRREWKTKVLRGSTFPMPESLLFSYHMGGCVEGIMRD